MKIRITENQAINILKEDDFDYKSKVIELLKSGQIENIELAFQIGDSGLVDISKIVNDFYGILVEGYPDTMDLKQKVIKLTNTDNLHLIDYGITILPNSFSLLTNLKWVSLKGNFLKSLPNNIGNLINLTSFNISHNELISLPDSFYNLVNLKSLKLIGNPLNYATRAKLKMTFPAGILKM